MVVKCFCGKGFLNDFWLGIMHERSKMSPNYGSIKSILSKKKKKTLPIQEAIKVSNRWCDICQRIQYKEFTIWEKNEEQA